jgi:hypothetical protein
LPSTNKFLSARIPSSMDVSVKIIIVIISFHPSSNQQVLNKFCKFLAQKSQSFAMTNSHVWFIVDFKCNHLFLPTSCYDLTVREVFQKKTNSLPCPNAIIYCFSYKTIYFPEVYCMFVWECQIGRFFCYMQHNRGKSCRVRMDEN